MPHVSCRPKLLGAAIAAGAVIPLPGAPAPFPCSTLTCPPTTIAITNVAIVTMTSPVLLTGHTVVVRKRRIVELGPAATTNVPAGALVIDGNGRVLMPGLIDAHVHVRDKELPAYVAAGILTVRNMWGYPRLRAIKHDIKAGKLVGPTIYSVSPGLDAPPGQWPLTQFVSDAREADSVVAVQDGEGWRTIKVYQMLSLAAFDSIAAAAKRRGLRFAGHVPTSVPVEHALASGMTSIEHLSGYDQAVSSNHERNSWGWAHADPARFRKLAALTADARVWNCPTLAINASFADREPPATREKALAGMRKFVWTLHKAGAPLVAGTDAGIDRVPAGRSIVEEVKAFEAAGLSRYDALRTATVNGGELLNQPQLGTIALGAPAELILLRANPLDDLNALHTVEGVLLQGTWRPMPPEGSPPPVTAGGPASTSSPRTPAPAALQAPRVPSARD